MLRRLSSLAITVSYGGLSRLIGGSRGCVVLYYHGVTREQAPRFRRQMEWLASHYSLVPLRALLRADFEGHGCVCITFDDALDNVRQHALPILKGLSIPATMFAVAGNLGCRPSWDIAEGHPDRNELISTSEQLREYPADLVEIGSHTMTHPDLATLTGKLLDDELVESKKALECLLDAEVESLSVPFGSYNDETLRAARRAGYRIVLTCDPKCFLPGDSPFQVGRFKVTPDDWGVEFRFKSSGAHTWRRLWHQVNHGQRAASMVAGSQARAQDMEPSK